MLKSSTYTVKATSLSFRLKQQKDNTKAHRQKVGALLFFTPPHLVKNSDASNLNYMARNLNLVARSFSEMPTNFFALRNSFFGMRKEASGMRKKDFRFGSQNL